jgi:hypothetical protein
MSYEFFQDTYHVDTTFVEFYGIISAIPRQWRHLINTLLFFDNEKDSEKIKPHSISSISNSFDHLLIILTGITVFLSNSEIKMERYYARSLSPSVVGDCFNMKWQPLEVALGNVHG